MIPSFYCEVSSTGKPLLPGSSVARENVRVLAGNRRLLDFFGRRRARARNERHAVGISTMHGDNIGIDRFPFPYVLREESFGTFRVVVRHSEMLSGCGFVKIFVLASFKSLVAGAVHFAHRDVVLACGCVIVFLHSVPFSFVATGKLCGLLR
jgi:hypothetical protein